ncbi:prolyl oligopeptidase family serine peptidase [Burkholderiaceae bacterium UC74_6]
MLKYSLLFAAACCELISLTASAAEPAATASGYNQPPQNILEVMRAPSPPAPSVSPTQDKMVLVTWQDYPPMARVATPYLKLAGVRIEPRNHSKHDTPGGYGITPCATGFELVSLPGGASVPVKLPAGCPQGPVWSADGKRFAFANLAADAVELWIGDAATGATRKVPGVRLNPMFGDELQWLPDQKTLLVKLVPEKLGAPPPEPVVPNGPSIQETTGSKGQSSTYETRDTLNNTHDEALFDHYASTQLATVDAAALKVTSLGKPGIYDGLGMAPDGRHLLVETIHRPYSYVTTYDRFPHKVEIWDITQRAKIGVHEVADLPLADRVPIRGVPLGPRNYSWRATEPATLIWAEALDGGDWKVEVPARDKVMMHKAPFSAAPVEIARTTQRYVGLAWTEKPNLAFLTEYDSNKHWRKTFIKDVDQPQAAPRLLFDLSTDEKYANPGNFVYRRLPSGENVVRLDGDSVYMAGTGASPDGDRPFLDKLDLGTLKTQRLFRSDKTSYEQFLRFVGKDTGSFMTWRQSPSDAPNAFLRTLGKPVDGAEKGEAAAESKSTAITHIPDPSPVVRQISKRLVKYKRADGLELSFTLYTPPGYKEGTRVPTILYAYPLDYADASKAGQVTGSQMTFTRLRQYRLLLLAGYAIIDNAAFPIVGDPKRAYDTYLEQLVADAKAAVEEAVRIGVADPDRVGVTGHSHGALMTANLVAHSDLFRAGVATSGSYNKTLTPFGFQNESRSVWEAPDVYTKVSTFFTADKIKTPLLIVHGADDANPGTTPLQGVKLYEAIRGNGGISRLVMLPHEPHWYTAMESNEQLIYEMVRWFDKYVKNAPPKATAPK